MKNLKRITIWVTTILAAIYLIVCCWFYYSQEKLLFNTVKLDSNHVFEFSDSFEEHEIIMRDSIKLHGVLFKAKETKGLILWLPGGRGMIDSIGINAHFYTDLNYDLFLLNYRGFGKSEGTISSENQFNQDMQSVYDYFKATYGENKIIIFGYSLGTGPASALSANNNPKLLILKAPYFNMFELSEKVFPFIPVSLLQKYKFPIAENLQKTNCKVVIFHGDSDKKISIDVSYRLKASLKPSDTLFVLKGQGHNDFIKNPEYLQKLSSIIE